MSGDKEFTSIPVVDIKGLYSADASKRQAVAELLGKAARDVGFLYISGHDIEQKVIDEMIDASKEFFALSTDEKMKYFIGTSGSHKGYVPEGEEVYDSSTRPDHKEAFDVGYELPADHPLTLAKNPLIGPNRWPTVPRFQDRVQKYYNAVMSLGRLLCGAMALYLGLEENIFDSITRTPPSNLRLIHYFFDEAVKDAPGIGRHTDYEILTVLLATAPGLEVMNDKGQWIDAPPIPGTFVINIGDALEILTAGTLPSTAHRVRSVKEERFSFPFFYAADFHTDIQPLPEFKAGASNGKSEYVPVRMGDHMLMQAINTFKYMKKRVANGEIEVPDIDNKGVASFGYFKKLAAQTT